jgi:hypothetical protein
VTGPILHASGCADRSPARGVTPIIESLCCRSATSFRVRISSGDGVSHASRFPKRGFHTLSFLGLESQPILFAAILGAIKGLGLQKGKPKRLGPSAAKPFVCASFALVHGPNSDAPLCELAESILRQESAVCGVACESY